MKTLNRLVAVSLLGLGVVACSDSGSGNGDGDPNAGSGNGTGGGNGSGGGQGNGAAGSLLQYTPNQAKWDTFASKPFEGGTNSAHDPDGVGWISPSDWAAATFFPAPKSNIPWSIKWSRALCNTLLAEGFWGGHVGPWFHREMFGFSFWDSDPGNNNSIATLRAKWTGKLMPSLYCDPADAACDPNKTGPGSSP